MHRAQAERGAHEAVEFGQRLFQARRQQLQHPGALDLARQRRLVLQGEAAEAVTGNAGPMAPARAPRPVRACSSEA